MFTQKKNWSAERALKLYRSLAVGPLNSTFEVRYNWANRASEGFTPAEVDAIYAEVISKIPPSATKVLELGCGGGRFAAALRAAKPSIGYRGIDLVVENVEAAQAALPAEEFVVGTAEEYLSQAPVDWDFIVSVHCMFSCTNNRGREVFFQILDAKAEKGYVLVADGDQAGALEDLFATAVGDSIGVAESYISGARDFLTDATLKNVLSPVVMVRTGTNPVAPELPQRFCVVEREVYNELVAQHETRKQLFAGNSKPTQVKAVTTNSRGLVTAFGDKAVDTKWVEKVNTRARPSKTIDPDPET